MLRILKFFIIINIIAYAFLFNLVGCASSSNSRNIAEYHMQIGISQLNRGNIPEALKELLEAETNDPNDPLIQNNLGVAFFMREKYDLSETHLKQAIHFDSKYSDAKNNLARLYIEIKRFNEAEVLLKQVVDDLTYAQPSKALINLGILYFRQDKYELSKDYCLKALSFDRENCLAQNYYGRSLLELKNYSRAALALDKAMAFCEKSQFDEPEYYSAISYFRLGEKLKAKSRFEALKAKDGPFHDKANAMLSEIN